MFKRLFLPLGLLLAVGAALLIPGPGAAMRAGGLIPFLVATIFLINGHVVCFTLNSPSRAMLGFSVFVAVLTLLGGPALGTLGAHYFGLSTAMTLGLIVMSAMPPTLSSGIVITEIADGNVVLALALTIGINLAAILVVPVTVGIALTTQTQIVVPVLPLLMKMLLYVLLPFAVGSLLRRCLGKQAVSNWLKLVPSSCVILTVYAALSSSREVLLSTSRSALLAGTAAGAMVHVTLMLIIVASGRLSRQSSSELKAFAFVGSQKTIPVALTVLVAIDHATGEPVLACLLFHFFQLLLDSALASVIQTKDTESAGPGGEVHA